MGEALGATVIGTVGNDEKAELAKAHGCDHAIVYRARISSKRVAEITGGKKVPVVYNSVGKDTFMKSLDCLAPLGLLAASGNPRARSSPSISASGAEGIAVPHAADPQHLYVPSARRSAAMAKELFDVVQSGAVKIEINQTYPLRDAAQGASRPRSAQDHRLDGAHDLGDCRYGAAPR